MGKQKGTIYQCDNPSCGEKFFEEGEVFTIDGAIQDGEGNELLSNSMLCPDCLLKFLYQDGDKLEHVIDLSNAVEDEMACKEKKEEEEDIYDMDEEEDDY